MRSYLWSNNPQTHLMGHWAVTPFGEGSQTFVGTKGARRGLPETFVGMKGALKGASPLKPPSKHPFKAPLQSSPSKPPLRSPPLRSCSEPSSSSLRNPFEAPLPFEAPAPSKPLPLRSPCSFEAPAPSKPLPLRSLPFRAHHGPPSPPPGTTPRTPPDPPPDPLRDFGAARASHDSPRTPNVHISGPRRFKNTTKIPRKDLPERVVAGGTKKREILGLPPFLWCEKITIPAKMITY